MNKCALKYNLLKFSSSISPDSTTGNITWHHEAGPNIVAIVEEGVLALPGATDHSFSGKVIKVEQNSKTLELCHVEYLCRKAQQEPSGLEASQYALSALARSPCIALRYRTPNRLYRRVQVRFGSFQDWVAVIGILVNLNCNITYVQEQRPGQEGVSRPPSTLGTTSNVGIRPLACESTTSQTPTMLLSHHPCPDRNRPSSAVSWQHSRIGSIGDSTSHILNSIDSSGISRPGIAPRRPGDSASVDTLAGTAYSVTGQRGCSSHFEYSTLPEPQSSLTQSRPAPADVITIYSQSQGNAYPSPRPSDSAPIEILEHCSQNTTSNMFGSHVGSSQPPESSGQSRHWQEPGHGGLFSRPQSANNVASCQSTAGNSTALGLSTFVPTSSIRLRSDHAQSDAVNPAPSRKRAANSRTKASVARKRVASNGKATSVASRDEPTLEMQDSGTAIPIFETDFAHHTPSAPLQPCDPNARLIPERDSASVRNDNVAFGNSDCNGTCETQRGSVSSTQRPLLNVSSEPEEGHATTVPALSHQHRTSSGAAMLPGELTSAPILWPSSSINKDGSEPSPLGSTTMTKTTEQLNNGTDMEGSAQVLRDYSTQSESERQATLDRTICQLIHDENFLTLCEDVEKAWRRIGLGF